MRLKLYRAATMTEAMACVRNELGAEALILSTRRVAGGVEITAALEGSDPPLAPVAHAASRNDDDARGAVDTRHLPGQVHDTWDPSPERVRTETSRSGSFRPEPSRSEADRPDPAGRDYSPRGGDPPDASHSSRRSSARPSPARPSLSPAEILGIARDRATGRPPAASSGAPPDQRREDALSFHGVPPGLARRVSAGPLAFALSAAFRFAAAPIAVASPPLLLAGPPGAGKTLSVARLASRLVMRGTAPLVITADGQRAGATEQLAAFTRLLGIDLIVACTPAMISRALTRRVAGAPVLIDAPGTDAFDAGQQSNLAEVAAAAGATIALVLPAGLDPVEASDIAASHCQNAATLLIANRLDGARRLGGILAAAAAGLAMIEAGIGPGAADGLVPLTPELLAGRLMQFPDRHA